MAARKPTSVDAKAGDRKVSAIGAIVALVLAGIGGTAFLIQPNPQRPTPTTTAQPSPPPSEPTPVAPPPTTGQSSPPPTTASPEKIDKSTKPKPPPRDPG